MYNEIETQRPQYIGPRTFSGIRAQDGWGAWGVQGSMVQPWACSMELSPVDTRLVCIYVYMLILNCVCIYIYLF